MPLEYEPITGTLTLPQLQNAVNSKLELLYTALHNGDVIGEGAVGTVNIADNAVNGNKIPYQAIEHQHVMEAHIKTAHIADGNITTAKIEDLAVSEAKIAALAVTNAKIANGTIAHEVKAKFSAAEVLLRPAKEGHGLMAGGPVRAVMTLSGVKDVTSKCLGRTKNKLTNAMATIEALKKLKSSK